MRLYHSTTEEDASCILREGFRDRTDYYLTDELHTGVWLSDRPLDENEDVASGALLSVELDEARVTPFEWIEEGKPYRELLIPANIVNGSPVSRVLRNDDFFPSQ